MLAVSWMAMWGEEPLKDTDLRGEGLLNEAKCSGEELLNDGRRSGEELLVDEVWARLRSAGESFELSKPSKSEGI